MQAKTPEAGPDILSSILRQISSGRLELGTPFPIVVLLPYRVQNAVAGSGFPSSSSSDVVNFKQILYNPLVYTSREEEN